VSRILLLAAASGVPSLVYEVVWTREVALLVGGQVEAISAVLVAFFGGLALGARWLGPRADRVAHPLRLYGALEAAAGSLAIVSSFLLRAVGTGAPSLGSASLLAVSCALLLPITVLLGGTLPALLRAATGDPHSASRLAGWITGANTLGAVAGVATAAWSIPRLGLRATLVGAGLGALALAAAALALSRARAVREAPKDLAAPPPPLGVVVAAALVGVATLAYEVLAGRGAGLRLGSSLVAWALVLGLFLAGLALGNLALARLAGRARSPATALGAVESLAALAVVLGAAWLVPGLTAPASGLRPDAVGLVVLAVLPPALLMGGAFPLLVRLGRPAEGAVAACFARISAANTAGGIAGALLAPFVLLPALGLPMAAVTCAALNALVGAAFLVRGASRAGRGALRAGVALGALALAAATLRLTPFPPAGSHVLAVEHGRQATAVVLHLGERRDLIVDGDPEASTGGEARRSEELLAVLPLLLHPEPRRLLEVGFGAGITLATAARFPLEEIRCVEIAPAVLRVAPFFAPDNAAALGRDPRVQIVLADGRAHLARSEGAYDVVVANTLHPWSLGATGLYSREYFERIERALRADGIAVQWLPVERIGAESLAAILRTMLAVFPEGSVWWGAENLLVVGRVSEPGDERETMRSRADQPAVAEALRGLGIDGADALAERRLASFATARKVLGPGPLLEDDRPALEILASRQRRGAAPGEEIELARRLAEAGAREDPRVGPLLLWLESRVARAGGREEKADRRSALAEAAGLRLAKEERIRRQVRAARAEFASGRLDAAERGFRRALWEAPLDRDAGFGLARLLMESGRTNALSDLLGRAGGRPRGSRVGAARGPLLPRGAGQRGPPRHRRGGSRSGPRPPGAPARTRPPRSLGGGAGAARRPRGGAAQPALSTNGSRNTSAAARRRFRYVPRAMQPRETRPTRRSRGEISSWK
jgi:predicted membrane-bound spermidine synthase